MANGNASYPLSRASKEQNYHPNLTQATPNGHSASPRELLAANGTRPQIVRQAPTLPNLVTSGPTMKPSPCLSPSQMDTDDDNSSNGSSTPRGRPSAPNGSRKNRIQRDCDNSPTPSSTGLTSSVASQGLPPSLPHIQLSASHPKPEALKELIDHLTSPPLTSTPSEDTCRLVKQWRLSQYRDVREREHHLGPLLGWPSEYAMGATSEFHMDKALNAAFAPQDAELERWLVLPPVRPTFTYGFTSTAFTAPQKALTSGMLDSAKVMPAGEDPLFPFLAQKWINDSDSRREAERDMARAGATMSRALWTFYRKVCKWEDVDVDDTLTFTMVVSPEVCRLFVSWIEQFHSEERLRFHKDLVYAALMEDAVQVQKMRNICDRIKDWMRDLRLMNLKDALDIMIDANALDAAKTKEEEQRRTNGSTTNGSITNGLTTNESTTNTPITDGPSTNGSKPSEEEVNSRPAEMQRRSNSMTHKQRLEAEQAEWWERMKSEAELTEEKKTDEDLSVKLANQLRREEEEREREKRQSIKAGKAAVNPDQGYALLDASRFNWVPRD